MSLNNYAVFCRAEPLFSPGELVIASLCLEQSLALCADGHCREQPSVWLWRSQADGDSGHTGSRPFIAIILGPSPNCGELAGVRWGEAGGSEWRGFIEPRDGGRKRDEAGSGRWSLIRDWTAANLPAASAQHRDYWGGKKREHTPLQFNLSSSSSLSLTALFSSLFIVVSILPRKLSFSDSFCRSLLHRLSWFSTFWCPPLCFLSLLSISITLPPMCGQRAEACTWLRSTPSPVTVITDINTRPICRITAINQAALLKGHLVNFHLPAALTDSLRVWYGMET